MTPPEQDHPDRLGEIKQRALAVPTPPITSRELSVFVARALIDRDWLISEVERLRAALAAKAGAE